MKHYLVHDTRTISSCFTGLLLVFSAIFVFKVCSSDVKLAHLQSAEPMLRRVFVSNPAPEFELDANKCLDVLKTLYDLADSGDLQHSMLLNNFVRVISLINTLADQFLSFRHYDSIKKL